MSKTDNANLADLNARLLAADAADAQGVRSIVGDLTAILAGMPAGDPAAGLARMALAALTVVAQGGSGQAGELFEAAAEALAAAGRYAEGADEGSSESVSRAARGIRKLLLRANVPVGGGQQQETPAPARRGGQEEEPPNDPELLNLFAAEACDRIAEAEAALLAMESHPGAPEHVNTTLRAFHTIKGSAGFLHLVRIGQLAHAAESLLIRAREGTVRLEEKATLAFEACDMLRAMVEGVRTGAAVEPEGAEALMGLLTGEGTCGDAVHGEENVPDSPGRRPGALAEKIAETPASDAIVRMAAGRLDQLIDMVGELVIANSVVVQHPLVAASGDERLGRSVGQLGKIVRELQGLAMGLRMVSLKPTFQKIARVARDVARQVGKSVQLATEGEETEIDRNMVDVVADPLVHMIRNAVDHGIESPEERSRAGKDPTGQIRLRASHSGGNLVIELSDDGRGLDRGRILQKALEAGLVQAGRELTDAEAYALIFHPGFSTAGTITDISGRGVGMDVVKRNIESLRGKVEIVTRAGAGTTFAVHVPLTVAIAEAMLVRTGRQRYLLPTVSIETAFRPEGGAVKSVAGRAELVMHRGEALPVFRLGELFGLAEAVREPERGLLVVVSARGRRCALLVDELASQQQVVIKSLGRALANLRGVSGGAILGDGRVGLILDVEGLLALAHEREKAA